MEHKRLDSRSSAEIVADNYDLLADTILLRIPAKPLIQLQLVNKHWQSIIFDRSFIKLHSLRHPKPQTSFIIRPNSRDYFYFSPANGTIFPFDFDSLYGKILQSCNGLLLLESRNSKYGRKTYLVHNPTTNRCRTLENERRCHPSVPGISLAYDPSKSLHYKVVFVYTSNHSVNVYDSESDTWKSVDNPFPSYTNTHFNNGIYMNNRIYWFRPSSTSYYFDLETGTAGVVPDIEIPYRKREELNRNYIIESGGRVHCVSTYSRPWSKSFLVFELAEDDSGWSEVYRADVDRILHHMAHEDCDFSVLGFIRGETVEESTVFFHVPGKILRFGLGKRRFEVVLDLEDYFKCGESNFQCFPHHTFQFVESLAPV
ncbi:F-box and associated interaction domains-containing protein [Striga asiatica]|uniref:F-box and associated interaction domains-containing protein n=1 Tax=Striga asiatica TaxID=4170 RepID=A0A5A7R5Q9_STRAF|nr:F-box and associated interaction domains-containing protein [Striga asiatica]